MKLRFSVTSIDCKNQRDVGGWDGIYFLILAAKQDGTLVARKLTDWTTINIKHQPGPIAPKKDTVLEFDLQDGDAFSVAVHVFDKNNGKLWGQMSQTLALETQGKLHIDWKACLGCMALAKADQILECLAKTLLIPLASYMHQDTYLGALTGSDGSAAHAGKCGDDSVFGEKAHTPLIGELEHVGLVVNWNYQITTNLEKVG